jgi:hypothetical protein
MAFFYTRSWSGAADTTAGIGSEWVIVGGSGSTFKVSGGVMGPTDSGTTLARLNMAATTGAEAYVEAKVSTPGTAHEIYVGLTTTSSGTDLAAAGYFMRATGGRLRLYQKNADTTTLIALGPSAGNLTRTLVAGDVLRLTIHAGNMTMSVNGTVLYTLASTANFSTFVYPAIRTKGDGTTRFASVQAGDYGVESPPGPPAGQVNIIEGLPAYRKPDGSLVPLTYRGVWGGGSIITQPMKYVGAFQGPPPPISAPSWVGPDRTMQNPPALPAGYTALRTVNVTNAAQLTAALADATAGDHISIAPGLYTDVKLNLTDKAGTAQNPIVIRGPREADIRLGTSETDYGSGYVSYVLRSSFIWLWGVTLRNGPKGLISDESNDNWYKGLKVYNVEQEAVHMRNFSSRNLIEDCTIGQTGLKSPGFGEAMYNGTAVSNWSASTATRPGQPDACDDNVYRRNYCYAFTGEGLDIKEGTSRTIAEYNWFEGQSLNDDNSADTWIDVKGNDAIIRYNYGNTTFNGAYTVYNPTADSGMRATFRGNIGNTTNRAGQPTTDPAILVKTPNSGTIVYDDNKFQGSPSLTNITVTPVPTT